MTCKLKARVLLARNPFNFQPKLSYDKLALTLYASPADCLIGVLIKTFCLVFVFEGFFVRCFVVLPRINFFVNIYYQIYTWCSQQDLGSLL